MTDPEIMLAWLDSRISSTETWLDTHGPGSKRPWPESDIEQKRINLERYVEIHERYAAYVEKIKERMREEERDRGVRGVLEPMAPAPAQD